MSTATRQTSSAFFSGTGRCLQNDARHITRDHLSTDLPNMDRSGLLSAWWMPKEEEDAWEAMRVTAPHKTMFLTGVFIILNSFAHSLVRIIFKRHLLRPTDYVWLPHRLVELFHAAFSFAYSFRLFANWAEGNNTFLPDRVFASSPYQELLANAHSAYALYSIGNSLFNYGRFRRERVWLNVARGSITLGLNYLNLLFPCIMGARLRVYFDMLEIAIVVVVISELAPFIQESIMTLMLLSMTSLILCLLRFWITMCLLIWAYQWISSENVWYGVPSDVPVSGLENAYLTGMGIGTIVLSYLTFIDFRLVTQYNKEWTERIHRRMREGGE